MHRITIIIKSQTVSNFLKFVSIFSKINEYFGFFSLNRPKKPVVIKGINKIKKSGLMAQRIRISD